MAFLEIILNNPFVQGILVGGAGWLVNKVLGKRADTKAGKVTAALATSSAIIAQLALTEPHKTPAEFIVMAKGVVAVQLAKVGLTDADRTKYQPLIDAAIAQGVALWVKAHPTPTALKMPASKT